LPKLEQSLLCRMLQAEDNLVCGRSSLRTGSRPLG
jgi:hypothetical protein